VETPVPNIISLEQFANLELTVLEVDHHPDFTILKTQDEEGQILLCVQGLMTGIVLLVPMSI
jgi:hypothetical protein